MSSTEAKVQAVQGSNQHLTIDAIEQRLTEINKIREMLQFVTQCAEIRQTEQSVKILQAEIDLEITECHQKQYRCHKIQLQLAEAVYARRLGVSCITVCDSLVETREKIAGRLNILEVKNEEGSKKLKEWDNLAPLRLPSEKWVKKMLVKNRDELLKQLEKAKTKVDAGHNFFQELKQEMESNKEVLHIQIDKAITLAEAFVRVSQALKCRTKINRFLQLHEQLLNATTFNQILGFNLPFYDTVTRKIANIDYTLSTFELNIEQASEIKNCEWEEAETLLEPGCLDKIETLTVENPDGIEKKMKLAISKVDGLFDIFKTLTDYWDPVEDGVNDTLDAILAQTQFALREIQFM
ncbi:unnamed protein product [Orchesella dallaii]|uniref:Uncharacterized protein n=1 Tax=Orchesella dallaii TaxID=48710 RepID=A0ABP1QLK9_9HEXA